MRPVVCLFVAVVTAWVAGGCSSPPPKTETVVTGTVTLDGAPLSMGEVYFEKEDGSASGRGEIQPDGAFRVPSAPLGNVQAAVRTSNYAQYAGTKSKDGKVITKGGREGTYVPVPKKYEDVKTSGLRYDVAPDGKITIELTSK